MSRIRRIRHHSLWDIALANVVPLSCSVANMVHILVKSHILPDVSKTHARLTCRRTVEHCLAFELEDAKSFETKQSQLTFMQDVFNSCWTGPILKYLAALPQSRYEFMYHQARDSLVCRHSSA